MDYKPYRDYLFIEVESKGKEPEVTKSGFIIPAGEQMEQVGARVGRVIGIGEGVTKLFKGQKVVFNEHQYDLLLKEKETKKDILVGKESGIYAVFGE